MTSLVRIEASWQKTLETEFSKEYFKELTSFVKGEYGRTAVYPKPKDIFRALDLVPFAQVQVVILGQDPYHGSGQANGLSFAVNSGTAIPPSLKNIFTEIESDLGIQTKKDGDLSRWAEQGVLLLNSTLTVRAGSPASHQGKGWEVFTDTVIQELSKGRQGLVFMLWGNYARSKKNLIDTTKHLVLEARHPSPFSVTGFYGCKHFSQANNYMRTQGKKEIDWR